MKKFGVLAIILILAITTSLFTACVPKKVARAVDKMEDEGYEVVRLNSDDVADFVLGVRIDTKGGVLCTKGENILIAVWFEDRDDAKNFKGFIELAEDSLEDSFGGINLEYGRRGKVFYFGTKSAVKDFK